MSFLIERGWNDVEEEEEGVWKAKELVGKKKPEAGGVRWVGEIDEKFGQEHEMMR